MISKNNFMGLDGFVWWFGIVEDRNDPLSVGRCRVRIYGWHSEKKTDIPTDHLPWAHPVLPVTGNIGSVASPREGTMVFGFFLDGKDGQFPVMLGIVPGIPESRGSAEKGFTDPRQDEQLVQSPRIVTERTYNEDGSGVTIDRQSVSRFPDRVEESSVSRLAQNKEIDSTFIGQRKSSVVSGVEMAGGGSWSEPPTQYAAKYPYNHVYESESGHIVEFDDTPGAERIHVSHRTGTFEEIYPDGKKVTKVVKDKYEIIMSNDNILVMGSYNLSVKGQGSIMIEGDTNVTVKGNMITKVEGDMTTNVDGIIRFKGNKIFLN